MLTVKLRCFACSDNTLFIQPPLVRVLDISAPGLHILVVDLILEYDIEQMAFIQYFRVRYTPELVLPAFL